jgi:hypothetical protein
VRIGLLPLALAVAVAATRLTGAFAAADVIAYVYLAVITTRLTRHTGAFARVHAQGARIDV